MPKVKLKDLTRKLNGQKGGRPNSSTQGGDYQCSSDDRDTDEEFFCGSQPRRVDNSSSSFIMTLLMLQMVIDAASSCDCNYPNYKIDVASYKGFNCHLVINCKCGNQKRIWAAPENFDEACLLACKLSGIKQGQIQDFMTFMNFGYENDKGQTFTVNVYGPRLTTLSQDLDIKLDTMKKKDELDIFNQILRSQDTKVVHVSTDGMYPIRNNSGICVSSVMGSINGEQKIICEYKNGILLKIFIICTGPNEVFWVQMRYGRTKLGKYFIRTHEILHLNPMIIASRFRVRSK